MDENTGDGIILGDKPSGHSFVLRDEYARLKQSVW